MEPEPLADEIASTDPGVREAAWERLSSAGAGAVAPLIAVLCDEDSPVEWSRPAVLLRKIGDAAFDPLVEAIATAPTPEVARRAGWAFSGLEVSHVERFAAALRHPSPKVRGNAAYVLQFKGAKARPYVPELLPLLADRDPDVRRRALWALTEIGPGGVVPRLRKLRREGATPALRRHALTALAEVGGPARLDPADLALVRRLIAVKRAAERPEPMHLCGHWWALPTTDQAAVLDAFGLSAPEPVTMRLGGSIWNLDHHAGGAGVHGACARVYVSPAFDGWTLVFGDSSADGHRQAPVAERCAELSRRFGGAHWYGQSCGDDWNAWCIAERGKVVRFFDNEEPEAAVGGPHPAEEGWALTFEEDDERDLCFAADIAATASVDPGVLGADTAVTGHGVVALTECGLKRGHPKGSLEI
ncbi:HEAT repeat domain-containing protein [Phytomonospora endophytica]|uniref:HEAT repeat domain-containing protein n=1 Tax=Phytomonospora endophytica TaxID=714109 RepID=A0A841FEP5_9ACTN|nr:HEAT repeat domain-containing protein [Phytomonospora endophytica]MBB6035771.1 hypothetical protein [Phytomonospora endophytica]GIG69550.1 hypothetical protein Pen01_58450 [Phytomonospora endophytica]